MERRTPTPFPYQRTGAEFLQGRTRALLADEMGLGKTVQALLALPRGGRTIVVCPASLCRNWRSEARVWRPDLSPKLDGVPARGEIAIVSWGSLPDDVSGLDLRDVDVVLDEAHYGKNPKAQRTKNASALRQAARRTWLLTGTPVLTRPIDLYGILRMAGLLEETFGNWDRFVSVFEGAQNHWGQWEFGTPKTIAGKRRRVLGERHFEPARKALARVMLRRERAVVLPELPAKIYTDLLVSITGSHVINKANVEWELYGAETLPPFEMISEARRLLAVAKIPAMVAEVERFEEEEVPLLVFSAHVEPIAVLEGREGWAVITGKTSLRERDRAVTAYQAGELRGLGLTIGAGGVGLTLTHGAHELFVDEDYTPALNHQAQDRAVRIGQKASSVEVRRLIADHPLDRRLAEILSHREDMIRGILG